MLKRFMFFSLLLLLLFPLFALQTQEKADSVYLFRFMAENDMFHVPYGDNAARLESLCALVRQHREAITAGRITVRVDSYCSSLPENAENLSVALLRSKRVKSELILKENLRESHFRTHIHAVPYGGMKDVVVVSLRIPQPAVAKPKNASVAEQRKAEKPEAPHEPDKESTPAPTPAEEKPAPETPVTAFATPNVRGISLRANLLRWATLTPDLGVEWRINRHWGILVGGSWTSWSQNSRNRRYALWRVSPEVHYYIGKEKHGFVGAMYHIGEFNYKVGETGRQGDYQGSGITGGYRLPLNRSLSLDFHAAAGYTRAEYDKYTVANGFQLRQDSDSKNYWGINSVGVTLAWKPIFK